MGSGAEKTIAAMAIRMAINCLFYAQGRRFYLRRTSLDEENMGDLFVC